MYAVLAGPSLWEGIEKAFEEYDGEIVYNVVGDDLDPDIEFPKVERLSLRALIVDSTSFSDSEKLKKAIMNFKIRRDTTRIIILAPGVEPGDSLMSFFFSVGIYDILNSRSDSIKDVLLDCLQSSPSYKRGVRWFTGQVDAPSQQTSSPADEDKVIEFREKIIGTVTVAFASVRPGLGCSFLALQAAFYLSYNFRDKKIALISFGSFNDFLSLAEMECFSGDSFSYKGIDFFNAYDVALLINRRVYDYILLDIGVLKTRSGSVLSLSPFFAEFVRSDAQFLVTTASPWHIENMLDCLFDDRVSGKSDGSTSWSLLFNFSSKDGYRRLDSLERVSYLVPFYPYVFKYDQGFFDFLTCILRPVLPHKIVSRKSIFSLFR